MRKLLPWDIYLFFSKCKKKSECWTICCAELAKVFCWWSLSLSNELGNWYYPSMMPLGDLNLFFFFFPEASPDRPSRISRVLKNHISKCCCWQGDGKWTGCQSDLSRLQRSVIPDDSLVRLHLFTYTSLPPSFSSVFHMSHFFISMLTWN